MKLKSQRKAIFQISADILIELFKSGRRCYEIVDDAIPDDAKIVGAEYNSLGDYWNIAVTSKRLPNISPAAPIPILHPVVVRDRLCEQHPEEARKRAER